MPVERVCVVGMGPGAEEYLVPLARKKIEEADILVGSPRLTRLFPGKEARGLDFSGEPPATVRFIRDNRERKRIAVLVSGDPGLFSFLGVLARYLKPEEYEIVPGISSVQMAFARLKDTWEDAFIHSVHGRRLDGLVEVVKQHRKVALLADGRVSPREIARHLREGGIDDRELVVCSDLSYSDEKVAPLDPETSGAQAENSGNYVMIIRGKRPC